MQSSLLSHIKRTKKRQREKENDLPLPSVLLSPHQHAQQVFPSALLSPPLPAPPRPLLNISRAPGGIAATSPPLSISHESSFSLRMRTTLLVCVPSHDATSACRVSLLPSPAELAVLDKICWVSWRRYCTKTTSPELLGKLLQVMQVASNSRGFQWPRKTRRREIPAVLLSLPVSCLPAACGGDCAPAGAHSRILGTGSLFSCHRAALHLHSVAWDTEEG